MVDLLSSPPKQRFSVTPFLLLKYSWCLLVFLAVISTPLMADPVSESHELVAGASVEQGPTAFDRRSRSYRINHQVAVPEGANFDGGVFLFIIDATKPVTNAHGDVNGIPFFNVTEPNQDVLVTFSATRGRLSYNPEIQQIVAVQDSDGDGISDDVDPCPNDAGNDTDGDGICFADDVCPNDAGNDTDGDGICFADDVCPDDAGNDTDGDGICFADDVCPDDAGNDTDGDGICFADDVCPDDAGNDADGDGICFADDVCPDDAGNDTDGDGICFADDLCPDDETNLCFTIEGIVLGGGAALDGGSVTIGNNTQTGNTDGAGEFTINVGPDELSTGPGGQFFPVTVELEGFANGFKKVALSPGVFNYSVTLNMQQHSTLISEEDDVQAGVTIVKNGAPVGRLTIPQEALPEGVNQITGNVTYLAPGTDDMLSMPGGDLLALPVGADPNADPVSLETFGMMEFNLFDQDGEPLTELPGSEVCMSAEGLGLSPGDTVPLWYYDEAQGLWVEEGQGTVIVGPEGGEDQICGEVNHFSWWNYDKPISTHACLRYDIVAANGTNELDGINWYAEGSSYNGTSPGRSCSSGNDNFDSFSVKRSDGATTEQIRVYGIVAGNRYYLQGAVNGLDSVAIFTLTKNSLDAALFDVPTVQGSCLSSSLNGACVFLDHQSPDSNGILRVDSDINLPPVISDFGFVESVILVGGQSNVSAMVTDPEGADVRVDWFTSCNYFGDSDVASINPIPDNGFSGSTFWENGISGSTFDARFNAPDSISGLLSYCQVKITATDDQQNRSIANRWITVTPGFLLNISGTLYGTDGLPMGNTRIKYDNDSCPANVAPEVTTESDGTFEATIDLESCLNSEFPEDLDFGYGYVEYDMGGYQWTSRFPIGNQDVYFGPGINDIGPSSLAVAVGPGDPLGCSSDANGIYCNVNVYLPVLWADLSGEIANPFGGDYVLDIDASNDEFAELGEGVSHKMESVNIPTAATAYGPIPVPVGDIEITLSPDGIPEDSEILWYYIDVLSTNALIQDLGDLTGTVQVTVEDGNGAGGADRTINLLHYPDGSWTRETKQTGGSGAAAIFNGITVGELSVTTDFNGPYYPFYGLFSDRSSTKFVDLGSSLQCTVNLTLYSPTRMPLADRFVWVSYPNGWNELITDDDGKLSFMSVPGWHSFDYVGSAGDGGEYYGYRSFYIDNCRDSRVINVDMPTTTRFDFGRPYF